MRKKNPTKKQMKPTRKMMKPTRKMMKKKNKEPIKKPKEPDPNPKNKPTPPIAVDDASTTEEDTAVVVEVLTNDSDADGDDLTVLSATDPDNGSVTVNADGTVTYTPDEHFNGVDTFTYTISDGKGGSDTATGKEEWVALSIVLFQHDLLEGILACLLN